MPDSYPLREQKKQRTHAQLIEAADQTFLEQGYNNTTMEAVAAAAGMHVQTLYRHFPSKIELAIAIHRTYFENFEALFLARETKTLTFWRTWVEDRMSEATANGDETFRENLRERFTLQETPAAFFEVDCSYQALLATGFATDLDVSLKKDRRPMLIACLLWSSYRQTLRDWALSESRINLVKEAVCVVDAAIDLLDLDKALE